MKIRKRIFMFVLALVLCAFVGAAIAGCDDGKENDDNTGAPAKVTAFAFDFATGEYSFTGSEDASHYFVRVYSKAEVEESGIENINPVKSSRVSKGSSTSYSGTLELTLDPGEDYSAYVFSYGEDGVTYTLSDPVTGYRTSTYAAPSLTTSNIRFDIAEDGNSATVTLTNSFLSDANTDCEPTYIVKVYDAETGGAEVASVTVEYSSVKEETEEGAKGPTTTRSAEFTLDIDNVTAHWITITIKSNDSRAYNDSEESNRLAIAQSSDEDTGGDDQGGTKGGPK